MGQIISSGPFHRAELQMSKANGIIEYTPQPVDEVKQLDTEGDQKGNTTVDHVFKRTRDVYGRKARDLKEIDWTPYIQPLKNRPSPYDFPAFEHEDKPRRTVEERKEVSSMIDKSGEKPTAKKEKEKSKKVVKTSGQGEKKKGRLSHNKELDRCSLEEN